MHRRWLRVGNSTGLAREPVTTGLAHFKTRVREGPVARVLPHLRRRIRRRPSLSAVDPY